MTDNTQAELRDIAEYLGCNADELISEVMKWHNKQTLGLLDRLEAQFVEEVVVIFGKTEVKKQVPLSAIEAERERCKS